MSPSRILRVILFLLVFSCPVVNAQTPGFPKASTDSLLKKLRQVLEKEHLPGLMISMVKKDDHFSAGLGYADVK
ncbi:hypothetical protein BWI97_26815, partial [Siphonobacter sp. BAB-5405]|uniref:hypothetical protein n=1 Tax=Siphonobacter sp. BAB-5405 TaxID=1864825 RepID=UPI000CAA68D9